MTYSDEQAFPGLEIEGDWNKYFSGLSKREWFAGLALQALLTHPEYTNLGTAFTARQAVAAADLLIECLNNEDENQ